MKSILFIAFLALATIGCDTPEKSTGSDTTAPPMSDTATQQPSGVGSDTAATMPVDTTTSTPNPSDTTRVH
jgi:PBP1b-binding outer membrane lipoprotein LpoB